MFFAVENESAREKMIKLFNLRRAMNEVVLPKVELVVLQQLYKGYQQSPWMGSIDNESLE